MGALFRFRDHPLLLLIPGFFILFAIGWISSRSANHFLEMSEWVRHSNEVSSKIQEMEIGLEAAESNQRGYLLTGDTAVLATAEHFMVETPNRLEDLKKITADNLEQNLKVVALESMVKQRLDALRQGIFIRKTQGLKGALEYFGRDDYLQRGHALMRKIRERVTEIQIEEQRLLVDRTRIADESATQTRNRILVGSLVGILLFAFAGYLVTVEFRAKKRALFETETSKQTALRALSARSVFLANMSHEIRTPLHSIIGMADVLSDRPSPAEQEKCVSIIRRAGQLLMNLISDILDLSKIEAGRLEMEHIGFHLRELVDHTVGMIAFRASQKGLELSARVDALIPEYLMGDPTRIRQILLNLIANSIKFTQQGGIHLAVDPVTQDGKLERIRFSIRDTGIGIPESKQALIFEKFTQLNINMARSYGGTGLGLTLSRQLVELMGGTIWFESKEGQGTTFFIEVPAVPFAKQADAKSSNQASRDSRALRILVADDVEDNRLLIHLYLKHLPYQIEFARNGLEVLEKRANFGPFDLILMDIHMPKFNGYETAQKIREDERLHGLPRVPIIALTAYALKEDAVRSLEAGCDRHLTKPVTRDSLQRAILEITAGKVSESVSKVEGTSPAKTAVYLKRELEALVPNFLKNRRLELEQIAVACEELNFEKVASIAHQIKGVAGTFGFERLSEIGVEMQAAAEASNTVRVKELQKQAIAYLDRVQVTYL